MRYKAVIFDLDGTLLDTIDDIADSMNIVLERKGFKPHEIEEYKKNVGEGLEILIKKLIEGKMPQLQPSIEEIVKEIANEYRIEYSKRWKFKTRPYPKIEKLLRKLEEKNIKKAILSNKENNSVIEMTKYFFGDFKFEKIIGEIKGLPKKPDPYLALEIAKELSLTPREIVYVGDTKTDMETAIKANMYPVGVLWGFRTREELLEHGARLIISDPMELLQLFN